MSDGYEVYGGVAEANGLTHLGCWAHCRRYLVEAEAVIPLLVIRARICFGRVLL